MKLILVFLSLIICSLTFANSKTDYLNYKLEQMEGNYEGEYGVLVIKRCSVSVTILGNLIPSNFVRVKISQEGGETREIKIKLKAFISSLKEESLDDILVYDFNHYLLKFNNDLELTEAKIMKKNAEFFFDKLRCRQLTKKL